LKGNIVLEERLSNAIVFIFILFVFIFPRHCCNQCLFKPKSFFAFICPEGNERWECVYVYGFPAGSAHLG
jgi:hypothetical protein